MKFKKGGIPWNKGKKNIYSKESRIKMGNGNRGKINSMKGKKHSKASRINMSNGRKGMKFSEEHKKNIGIAETGEKHHNWKGGISNNPYPKEFNAELKLKIRTRDNFTCCLCGRTEREELEKINQVLCVNHIDFNKNNCKKNNLNTLCLKCNVKINREREYWSNYFNKLIF